MGNKWSQNLVVLGDEKELRRNNGLQKKSCQQPQCGLDTTSHYLFNTYALFLQAAHRLNAIFARTEGR